MTDNLQLPTNVVSRGDINRLERELLSLDEFIASSKVRKAGTQPKLPKTSRLFEELVQDNKLNALIPEDRARLRAYLTWLKENSPVIHMSFSSDPSPFFTQKLVTWLRRNIHPSLLISIGLQPGIGAGCIVRTRNKYFDLSLRQRFVNKRDVLINKLQPSPPKDKQ